MNRYQTVSRRLLAAARPARRGAKAPYWLTQRPLLSENWLARVGPVGEVAEPRSALLRGTEQTRSTC